MDLHEKLQRLKENIENMGNLAVAFSGGVDSTFLLAVAYEVLKDKAAAVTVSSPLIPKKELDDAARFVEQIGARHKFIHINPLELEGVKRNTPDRCYICKKHIFQSIIEYAREQGISWVADGSNVDDDNDYRPGMRALKELGVVSPLKYADMTKEDIRTLSREIGLSTWDKPALACLATRFPYGQELVGKKLDMVDEAENYLVNLGFRQVRVRCHDGTARIEVAREERKRFFDEKMMDRVDKEFKNLGFKYVSVDLAGYKTGNLNIEITHKK